MNEIIRNPAHTLAELASARQHHKTGRPSWSVRWRANWEDNFFLRKLPPTEKLGFASAPPWHQPPARLGGPIARCGAAVRLRFRHGFRVPWSLSLGTPPDKDFPLGDMGTCVTKKSRGLRLVDISRTPSGTFFKRCTPSRKWLADIGKSWRFVAFRDKQCSRPTCHRAAQALLGRAYCESRGSL